MGTRKTEKPWSKTSVQNLFKHRSRGYYARLFLGGKERWRSLRTQVLEVAKVRLREEQRHADQSSEVAKPARSGRMTMAMAIESLLNDLKAHVPMRRRGRKSEITTSTADYRIETIESLRRTWLQATGRVFDTQEIRKITKNDMWRWADRQRKELSSTRFNNTLGTLRRLFESGVQSGEIHRNLAVEVARSHKAPKKTYTPTRGEFLKLIEAIRSSSSRLAEDVGDFVEFLAYTGARREEASRVTWADVDPKRRTVTFRKTRSGVVRTVELISSAMALLSRMKDNRRAPEPDERVFKVTQAYGSLRAAAMATGIPSISHHDMRDLFATTTIASGVDIPTVAD